MVKENIGAGVALAGLGEHGETIPVPGWQLNETALLNPLEAATVPSKTVCWPGKMGPPTVPPVGSEIETVKSAGVWRITGPPMNEPGAIQEYGSVPVMLKVRGNV